MFDLKEDERAYYQKRNQQITNDEKADFEKNYSGESRKIFELANAFIATACNNQKNWLNKYTSQNERIANNSTMLGEIDYEVKIYDDDFNSSAIDVTIRKDDEFSILLYGLSRHGILKKDISINNICIHEPVIKTDKNTYLLPYYDGLMIKDMIENMIKSNKNDWSS